jgi:BirA family transcriptional regulator, biotin operon repressor / biotin---[acetyl-CoA-carboxylase] ligase
MTDFPVWLHYLETCPSTNTWAKNHAAALIHGDVVFTPQQTAGRGQQGRRWQSPEGVLTASFILDRFPVERLSGLSLIVGLSLIEAIEALLPDLQNQLKLKWPNDIWLQERKLAGILCESSLSSGSNHDANNANPAGQQAVFTRVVVGIGLNCQATLDQTELTNPAISLHEVMPEIPNSQQFLESIRHYLLHFCQALWFPVRETNLEMFLPMLRSRNVLLAKQVTLEIGNELLRGQVMGIDGGGQLQIKFFNGEVRSINSGRIIRLH